MDNPAHAWEARAMSANELRLSHRHAAAEVLGRWSGHYTQFHGSYGSILDISTLGSEPAAKEIHWVFDGAKSIGSFNLEGAELPKVRILHRSWCRACQTRRTCASSRGSLESFVDTSGSYHCNSKAGYVLAVRGHPYSHTWLWMGWAWVRSERSHTRTLHCVAWFDGFEFDIRKGDW